MAAIVVSPIKGQQLSSPLRAPFGPANQVASPDGAYSLFGNEKTAQLWLEDAHTHQRKVVANLTVQTLTLSWSPDSTAFIVNDRVVSNLETSYIYDVKTLNRLDLRSRILAADSEAAHIVQSETSALAYFHAIRWLDARHVEVQLHGFTGGTRHRRGVRSGECFDLRYRAGRDGVVQKLSQRVFAIDDKTGCSGL